VHAVAPPAEPRLARLEGEHLAHRALAISHRRQGRPRVGQERAPRLGERRAARAARVGPLARAPLEEARPDALLEARDRRREGRLRQVGEAGGRPERAVLGHQREQPELVEHGAIRAARRAWGKEHARPHR
jgi:hypothetical protein